MYVVVLDYLLHHRWPLKTKSLIPNNFNSERSVLELIHVEEIRYVRIDIGSWNFEWGLAINSTRKSIFIWTKLPVFALSGKFFEVCGVQGLDTKVEIFSVKCLDMLQTFSLHTEVSSIAARNSRSFMYNSDVWGVKLIWDSQIQVLILVSAELLVK